MSLQDMPLPVPHEASAHASELIIAVPSSASDIYALHQRVWAHVSSSLAVRARPLILFRRDEGLVRIRVSDCAMRHVRPVKMKAACGQQIVIRTRLALWRSVDHMRSDASLRAIQLIESSGLKVSELKASVGVVDGYKSKIGSLITLPIADVEAAVVVSDPYRFACAWREGIGRARRFGFGMLLMQ